MERYQYGLWVPRAPSTYAAATISEFQDATAGVMQNPCWDSVVFGAYGKVVRTSEAVPDSDAMQDVTLWGDGWAHRQDSEFYEGDAEYFTEELTASHERAVYCCRNVETEVE